MEDNKICITKGDSAYFVVDVFYQNGRPYNFDENDVLTFSVKKKLTDDIYAIQKMVRGSQLISLEPDDTANLSEGRYFYDVQLNTVDGDVFTVIPRSYFHVMEGVTE